MKEMWCDDGTRRILNDMIATDFEFTAIFLFFSQSRYPLSCYPDATHSRIPPNAKLRAYPMSQLLQRAVICAGRSQQIQHIL